MFRPNTVLRKTSCILQNNNTQLLHHTKEGMGSVRSKHAVLNLPVFKSEAFGTFRRQMHNVVSASENPLDASLEVVLPGVHERLNALQSGMNNTQFHGQMLNTMVAQLQQLQTSQSAGFYHQATGYRYMMQHCLPPIKKIYCIAWHFVPTH